MHWQLVSKRTDGTKRKMQRYNDITEIQMGKEYTQTDDKVERKRKPFNFPLGIEFLLGDLSLMQHFKE